MSFTKTALPFIPSKFEAKVKDTDLIIGFRANEKEVSENPRSRSAKLRAAEKVL